MLSIFKEHPLFRKAVVLAILTIVIGGVFTVIGVGQIDQTKEHVAKLQVKEHIGQEFFLYEESMTKLYGFLYAKDGVLAEEDFQTMQNLGSGVFDAIYYAEGGLIKFSSENLVNPLESILPSQEIDYYYQVLKEGRVYVKEVGNQLYFHQAFLQNDEVVSILVYVLDGKDKFPYGQPLEDAFYEVFLLDEEGLSFRDGVRDFQTTIHVETQLMSLDFGLIEVPRSNLYNLYMMLMVVAFFLLSGGLVLRYFYLETVKSKKYLKKLEEEARFDRVTGLANGHQLYLDVEHLIEEGRSFYFALGHLNNIKHINDRFGHHLGERLLEKMAKLLLGVLPEDFQLYRLGGDEYVVLGVDKKKNHFANTVKRLLDVYGEDILIDQFRMNLSMTMGIAHYPSSGKTVDQLIHNAHMAMRDMLVQSQNTFYFFEPSKYLEQIETEDFDQYVKRINLRSFELVLMPVVETKSNAIVGFECLSRIYDDFGVLMPTEKIIHSLERVGRIQELDELVFERMLSVKQRFEEVYEEEVVFSVNASAISFNEAYVDKVIALKEKANIKGVIVIELTESYKVEDYEYLIRLFKRLNQVGIEVGIDDFGSGYSSIGYIAKFPLYAIKVDKRFVRDYKDSMFNQTLLKTLISISDVLGCKLVAEGVDTHETLAFLREHACPYYQGFLFHKGVKEEGALNLYKKHRRVKDL